MQRSRVVQFAAKGQVPFQNENVTVPKMHGVGVGIELMESIEE